MIIHAIRIGEDSASVIIKTSDSEIGTSEEIFAANEITMINYWGTWCFFCVKELGELAKSDGAAEFIERLIKE